MTASRLSSLAAAAAAAVAASQPALSNRAHAESPFRFSPFSSSSSPQQSQTDSDGKSSPAADEPRGGGFDAESLERGAKALREINSSTHAKQVRLYFRDFFMYM